MPVSRPTLSNSRWAESSGGAVAGNVIGADSATRDAGFQGGQDVPSGIINALHHEGYSWFKYLNDLANQVFNWQALHTFTYGLSVPSGTTATISQANITTLNGAGAGFTGNVSVTGSVNAGSVTATGLNVGAAGSNFASDPTFPARTNVGVTVGAACSNGTPGIEMYRDAFSTVRCLGRIALSSTLSSDNFNAFTLPTGYRPTAARVYICPITANQSQAYFVAYVNVGADGVVNVKPLNAAGGSNTSIPGGFQVDFSGVAFSTTL